MCINNAENEENNGTEEINLFNPTADPGKIDACLKSSSPPETELLFIEVRHVCLKYFVINTEQ